MIHSNEVSSLLQVVGRALSGKGLEGPTWLKRKRVAVARGVSQDESGSVAASVQKSCVPWVSELSSDAVAVLSNPSNAWSLSGIVAHCSLRPPTHIIPGCAPQNSLCAFTQAGTPHPPAISPSSVCGFNFCYFFRSSSNPPLPLSFLRCCSPCRLLGHSRALPHAGIIES